MYAMNTRAHPSERLSVEDILSLTGLLILVVFLFSLNIDRLPLLDPDEPRYAASARAMIETGDWFVPHFNGEPRLNKPPLFYWLVALSFKLFGVSESAARLPSLLCGIGGIVVVFMWARTMWGRRKAFLAGFILAVCPLYYVIARLCITDMTMSFFLCLALYCFYCGYESGRNGRWNKVCIYFSLAMMFLSKGHIGVLIFLLVISTFLATKRDLRYLGKLWSAPGLIIFAALVLPWGVTFISRVGTGSVAELLLKETYGRFVGGYQHPEPFYFYIKVFFVGFFPWSLFAPVISWRILRWRKVSCQTALDVGQTPDTDKALMRVQFFAIWFGVVILLFSMSRSKLFSYILPMAPSVPLLFVALSSNAVAVVRRHGWAPYLMGATAYLLLVVVVLSISSSVGSRRSARDLTVGLLPSDRDSYALVSCGRIPPSLVFYAGKLVQGIGNNQINALNLITEDSRDVYIYMKNKDYNRYKDVAGDGCRLQLIGEGPGAVMLKAVD